MAPNKDERELSIGKLFEKLGGFLGCSDSVAHFERGELRKETLGPAGPRPLSWYEPVLDGALSEKLEKEGRLLQAPPTPLSGWAFFETSPLGWMLVESEDVYVIDDRGWHRVVAKARARRRRPKTSADRALILAARALAQLAPDTLATVDEVQVIAGARESVVRDARPAEGPEQKRCKSRAIGPWLERLGMREPDTNPQPVSEAQEPGVGTEEGHSERSPRPIRRPGRRRSEVRPLGGPGTREQG